MPTIWAMLWRSVFLLPVVTIMYTLVCLIAFACIALPLAAGFFVWHSDWRLAGICVAFWIPSFVVARWWWRRESVPDERKRGILI